MNFNITNTAVYGLDRAIKASGNPMRTVINTDPIDEKDINRAAKLGNTPNGLGHDNYLKGILVHVDITAPLYWWKEAQRYHWFDFVSSQSTMHCLLKFDVATQVVDDTDPRVVAIIKELIEEYNAIEDTTEKIAKWRQIVASLPCGFCLGATMTTNYQQLKTMYRQRRHHKLVEWHVFCDWCLTLPMFDELTGVTTLKAN
jgi:hypothetical protein